MRASTANLIAALRFICTEYRLDEKGPALAEPEFYREASNRGGIALHVPKDDAIERLPNGDVKSRAEYPPE